jgi:hypothetical protein
MPSSYTFDSVTIRWLDTYTDPDEAFGVSIAGTVTTDRTTAFNAAFFRLLTGNRGRHWAGAKHFGPIPESHTTGDELNSDGLTAWNAVATSLTSALSLTAAEGNVYDMLVVSPTLSVLGDEPVRTISYASVDTITLSGVVGTMRHRKERPRATV